MPRLSLLCAAATMALAAPAFAGFINYGDFAGDTVTYRDVSEFSDSDPGALYGAPQVGGDTLFFNGMTFSALASGAGGTDKTRGILTTTIEGDAIHGLSFREAGSYTLSGLVNDAFASVAAAYHISVLEIDGQPVSPVDFQTLMTFDPSDGDFSIGDDGAGTGLWEGLLNVDIDALLASRGRSGNATAVSIIITNTLNAISQDQTSAAVAKKNLSISVIPAPASAFLFLLGAGCRGRRRRV